MGRDEEAVFSSFSYIYPLQIIMIKNKNRVFFSNINLVTDVEDD